MVTIAKLSVGTAQTFWVNWQPGIYYYNFDGTYDFLDAEFIVDVPTISGVTDIGSVFSDNVALTKVDNTDDLQDSPSFYYDSDDNAVYIRLENYESPAGHDLNVGPVYGLSNETYIDEDTETVYESRLRSVVNITRKKDALFFGKITYSDFTVELDNADYFFYILPSWDVYGQPFEVSYGDPELAVSAFDILRTGRIKEYTFEGQNVTLYLEDPRRVLSKDLPVTLLTSDDYSDIDRDEDKYIPICYGECKKVPCRVLDDGAAGATFEFTCADVSYHSDGIYSIDAVYVDGVEVTTNSESLPFGTFTLLAADYNPGQTVTADIKGYMNSSGLLIENPLDIIKDMLTVYLDIQYNSNYFDTTAWEAGTLGKADINYCIFKQTSMLKVIEAIASSFLEGFEITPGNKFTWLTHDDDDDSVFTVEAVDWLEPPKVEYSSDEAISSATVEYAPDWNSGEYKTVINDDNYDTFVRKFRGPNDYKFTTVLTNKSDAESAAEEWDSRYGDVQIFITGEINLNLNKTGNRFLITEDLKFITTEDGKYIIIDKSETTVFDLHPGYNITLEVDGIEIRNKEIVRTDFIGSVKTELLELVINTDDETATIKGRVI